MLTVPQAAKRVRRHPETIRRWIRSGRLRAQKIGTQHLVEEEDLYAVAVDRDSTQLPQWMRVMPDGRPQPNWVRMVRDSRRSH